MSESTEQQHTVYWFRMQYPDRMIFAIPNGQWLPVQNIRRRMAYTAKRKREGLLSGVSDIFIAVPRDIKDVYAMEGYSTISGLFLEMKDVGKTEKDLTDNQRWFIAEIKKQGYEAKCAFGFEHAKQIITDYMRGAI